MQNPNLAGRTILVTGASAGIGAGLARRLAVEGADVRLAARRADKLEEHVAAIRAAGGRAAGYACDITSTASVSAVFEAIAGEVAKEREKGGIDAVVNTAAALWLEPFAGQSEESWQAMVDTNLTGAIRVTQVALAHMLPRGAGHVIHFTSSAAQLALPYLAVYSATKAGLSHFLAAMRGEYGKSGVRFTEMQIGNTVGTEGGGQAYRKTTPDMATQIMRWTGAPEMMAIDDVVDAALWALSTPARVRLDRIVLRELAEIPT